MSKLVTIYSVDRIPSTAQAKNTVGYKATTFEIVADSESEAVSEAQASSRWDGRHFAWRVRGSRVVVIDDE